MVTIIAKIKKEWQCHVLVRYGIKRTLIYWWKSKLYNHFRKLAIFAEVHFSADPISKQFYPAAAAKSLQSCPTLCDPIDGSPPGSPSLGFSRQEHWSGVPFPSPMHESEKWKGSRSVVSDSSRPHGLQPTRLLCTWDSPGKNTGVGCHFLLQCMKVESESEVAQSCPTLSDPMDCSLPGSSIYGIFQARVLEWVAIAFSFKILGVC